MSVLLGPSGTGKTVFLKSLVGLLKPEEGRVLIGGVDMVNDRDRDVFEARKRFGLMFQDGALFGSLPLFDNIAFPLREHTRKKEPEIRRIVMERMEMVGLAARSANCPARSPAACASAPASPARSSSTRRSFCATSPTPAWTPSARRTSPSC
ncbi:ATP-binding cassette domain-containing protein [Actinomadura luteofluorescens]|uniref:ATP-binding cassette domain-containing protein n=1 Tax=Actinomadura luteofluorescens TaxID=46163 RepID=UPI00362CB811